MAFKTNFFLDLAILLAFLIAFEPALTGIPIHEWLSLALVGALIVHLLLHWKWITSVTIRFFQQLIHSSRLNYIVDAATLIAYTIMMFSGILISRSILEVFGVPSLRDPFWRILHARSADASLLLTGLHFALHWKWITNIFARYIVAPVKALVVRQPTLRQQVTAEE